MLVDRFGVSERRACRVVGQHRSRREEGLSCLYVTINFT